MPFLLLEKDGICALAGDRVVIWDKPSSGDVYAPYKHPEQHLAAIYFCSDWSYYALQVRAIVSVTHQAVSGQITYDARGFGTKIPISYGRVLAQDQLLVPHNLGYPPRFAIAQNNRVLPNGMNVQALSNRGRLVSFYATDTAIYVRNVGGSSDVALPALTISYDVLVFKTPLEIDALPLFQMRPARGIMGRGKIDTDNRTMRIGTDVDSPFYIPRGRCIDLDSGASRVVVPNGPSITQAGYGGSFTGSPFLRTFV